MKNTIEFEVCGELGLFTNPQMSEVDSKSTYPIPTYGVLIGVCESIYWQPSFLWVIDEVRVMNQIKTYNMAFSGSDWNTGERRIYKNTYLIKPRYQILAHFEWDFSRPDLSKDRIEGKHYAIVKRCLSKGGRKQSYLGAQNCAADIEPCIFGEGESYYDGTGQIPFGIMYHSKKYSARIGTGTQPLWWQPVMTDGIIKYARPEQCTLKIA